jgi:hypothetical protein
VARTTASATKTKPHVVKKKKPHVVRVDPNFKAALAAGLPRSVARALAAHKVAVVQLISKDDQVAALALGEARVGAKLADASLVTISVDGDGGAVEVLTRLLGELPNAPTTLVYQRPGTLYVTLQGFNDRTIVQQAAANAASPATAGATTLNPSTPATTTTDSD